MAADGRQTVLVVDDEQHVADVFALYLRDDHDVRVAYGGEEALERVDEAVDVVLLDRRMPDISGDGVLNELRVRGYDCAVVMITAVSPSFDVADMPFDEYLCKPVDREELRDAVADQVETAAVDNELLTKYAAVTSKLEVLEEEYPADRLSDSEQYESLRAEADRLHEQLADEVPDLEERFGIGGAEDGTDAAR